MAVLTTRGRKKIKKENFAIPAKGKVKDGKPKGRYPIHDISHARNALARVAQYGTPAEKAQVKKAVYKKYPSLDPKKKKNKDK